MYRGVRFFELFSCALLLSITGLVSVGDDGNEVSSIKFFVTFSSLELISSPICCSACTKPCFLNLINYLNFLYRYHYPRRLYFYLIVHYLNYHFPSSNCLPKICCDFPTFISIFFVFWIIISYWRFTE